MVQVSLTRFSCCFFKRRRYKIHSFVYPGRSSDCHNCHNNFSIFTGRVGGGIGTIFLAPLQKWGNSPPTLGLVWLASSPGCPGLLWKEGQDINQINNNSWWEGKEEKPVSTHPLLFCPQQNSRAVDLPMYEIFWIPLLSKTFNTPVGEGIIFLALSMFVCVVSTLLVFFSWECVFCLNLSHKLTWDLN